MNAKVNSPKRECQHCKKLFKPTQEIQRFCSGKCRRRVQHLRHITKYPEAKTKILNKLLEWKALHQKEKRRRVRKPDAILKRDTFKYKPYPRWLLPL